jgi:thiamine biosynthesis lipoprotein
MVLMNTARRTVAILLTLIASSALHAIAEPQHDPVEVRTEFTKEAVVTTVAHNAMGTTFHMTLIGKPGEDTPSSLARIANEAFVEIDAIESRISRWRSDSQTSRINKYAHEKPVRVTPNVATFLLDAQRISTETGGAFDCTVGPLIETWRTARESNRLPTQSEIAFALKHIGFGHVKIDASERSVRFAREGIQLDFGAIGKGYALDVAAEVLAAYGVEVALLDGGASTYLATGIPPGQAGWTVRIHPPYNEDEVLAEVVFGEGAFSTSTNAGTEFVVEGRSYGHILDPRTGWPAQGKRVAISLTKTAAEADALSTAFYVMDIDSIRQYCENHPDVRAMIVPKDEPNIVRINFENREE